MSQPSSVPVSGSDREKAIRQAAAELVREGCREELGAEGNWEKCNQPAEFVLWGKLIPPEGLGPRCYDHAAKHVGHDALCPNSNYALMDLRPVLAALSPAEPRGGSTDRLETCEEKSETQVDLTWGDSAVRLAGHIYSQSRGAYHRLLAEEKGEPVTHEGQFGASDSSTSSEAPKSDVAEPVQATDPVREQPTVEITREMCVRMAWLFWERARFPGETWNALTPFQRGELAEAAYDATNYVVNGQSAALAADREPKVEKDEEFDAFQLEDDCDADD